MLYIEIYNENLDFQNRDKIKKKPPKTRFTLSYSSFTKNLLCDGFLSLRESTQGQNSNHAQAILADIKPCLSPSLFPTTLSLLPSINSISPCPMSITALHCTLFFSPLQPHKSINTLNVSASHCPCNVIKSSDPTNQKLHLIRSFYSSSTEINSYHSRASQFLSEILSFFPAKSAFPTCFLFFQQPYDM